MTQPVVLIIGGGLAGLFCALKLAPLPVKILTDATIGQGSSSVWAQGGVAAAVLPEDSPELHAKDTITAGAGLVDPAIALSVAKEAQARIDDLLSYGAPFDKDKTGALIPSQEAAHSARRIVRVKGDGAGAAIMTAVTAAVRATPSISFLEGYHAVDLIQRDGRIVGALARDASRRLHSIPASAVVLATGGVGHLYAVTTNPVQASGQGLAMAARAGARITDAEFVQYHPTAIDIGIDPAPLATEALRGEGAILINRDGRRFMTALHPDAELAPRDIVARGVFAEISANRGAFLDARAAIGAEFPEKFPHIFAVCQNAGIDPRQMPIPIAPAEHYHMGGVDTDAHGRSSLPGLWAIGEIAATGLHGANRLASNSLLEAIVFAERAARDIASQSLVPPSEGTKAVAVVPQSAFPTPVLRSLMTRHVGVLRHRDGLSEAVRTIGALHSEALARHDLEGRNQAEAALLIAASAYLRQESRGGHFRLDYPNTEPAQERRSSLTLQQALNLAQSLQESSHAGLRS